MELERIIEPKRRLSDYKVRSYQQRFEYLDEWESNHREHQVEALLAQTKASKGQIISPCGTGKTRIQISSHVGEMIELSKAGKSGVFVIASHRLSLNRQLLGELIDVAIKCGVSFDIAYVGSYKCDLSKYYARYHNLGYTPDVSRHLITTSSKEIEKFVSEARYNGRHVLIASTYDSFARLKNIGSVDLTTFDEAHNTTQDDFKKNILETKPNLLKEYYFTATRKIAGADRGMNDETFYGKVLFDVFPKLMLAEGEIVCPQLHVIKGKEDQTTNSSNTDMLVKNTIEAFNFHKNKIKEASCSPEEIGAKLLVGCNSIEEMERIYHSKTISEQEFQAFAISSEGSYVNGTKCGKEEFFTRLNALGDSEDALIFNVDMLTEGIDLPSITGVMPLRNLGLTKLIQLIGRALRLHKIDRKKLYAGNIIPCQYKDYVKPYGYVIIPEHLSSIDHHNDMIKLAELFYSQYGTMADNLIIEEKFVDHQPERLKSMIPYPFKDGKDYELEHGEMSLIDEVNLAAFRADMAEPNSLDYLKRILS